MKKYALVCLSIIFSLSLSAQTNVGLVAYYTFDGHYTDATGNTANTAIPQGTPEFRCGVKGDALLLDGAADVVYIPNGQNVNREFDTEDFTVSFYFKPIGLNGQQYLISKRDTACTYNYDFYVKYVPDSRTVNGLLREIPQKTVSVVKTINNTACWQHLVLVRDNTRVKMYVNTKLVSDLGSQTRIDLTNDGDFIIGSAICRGANEIPFHGLIDELRIYNRALDDKEIKGLYFAPDQIVNPDTLIFLGTTIDIELTNTCADNFLWTPNSTDISSVFVPNPSITPVEQGIYNYTVQMTDLLSNCTARDSIRINAIDPNLLDCEAIYLAKAFTPNNDGLNDTYGISNPFSVQELLSFEIFDRWGNRVFYTTDSFATWDGNYNGQRVNPGVFLYKVRHVCNGEEKLVSGSVTVLR
ncbi:MAG: gliding motility-associated C-terminal domain-containing protein [Saprospiraceae bacterium]|nr:gliding motility-associated C-terminal domain-containing protein [Saprospiraceae bacterium]MCB9324564.1 gliding motility-associated C-terminal domain-containing protein [Lewinellaceae bacterium]